MADCEHVGQIRDVAPQSKGCEACEREGKTWVAVRKCLTCGHVGCCDSTPGRHARAHFAETGHPLIEPMPGGPASPADARSAQRAGSGDGIWTWCYVDDTYVQR
ncbi:MAG TPA: UBP-type zinc finger domain-containing protein [Myxococcales bacterium]|jgi:hypothetical protein